MKVVTSIAEYCQTIDVPPPRYPWFDVRRFEDNMKTVNARQPPFRHQFYCIALRHFGSNREVLGQRLQSHLFFNSPYQVITWDIQTDWQGYYVIFGSEFIAGNPAWRNFIAEYPFFRIDKPATLDLPEEDRRYADSLYQRIFNEYHGDNPDKFQFIQAYTQLLLLLTKRHFVRLQLTEVPNTGSLTADVLLLARFQRLLETRFSDEGIDESVRHTKYYAEQLHVHPNHLNAVVKRITGKTASQTVREYLTNTAKSLLRQTVLSIKEIAYRLRFKDPTHFNAFFKKACGMTPQAYRHQHRL